ncbi:hypothetical protein [Ochrobactrum sp. RH2CCR150]
MSELVLLARRFGSNNNFEATAHNIPADIREPGSHVGAEVEQSLEA